MRYFETVNVSEQYDIPKIVKNIFYITYDLFLKYIVLRVCTIVPSHSQIIETRNHYTDRVKSINDLLKVSTHENEMCFDRDFGCSEISQSWILRATSYSFECEFCFFCCNNIMFSCKTSAQKVT